MSWQQRKQSLKALRARFYARCCHWQLLALTTALTLLVLISAVPLRMQSFADLKTKVMGDRAAFCPERMISPAMPPIMYSIRWQSTYG